MRSFLLLKKLTIYKLMLSQRNIFSYIILIKILERKSIITRGAIIHKI